MIKRLIIFFYFTFFYGISFAQKELHIKFNEIKAKVEDVNSESYYPKLLKRFNDFESN